MAVSKRLRFEIFRRDNHTCRYCGATGEGVKLVVDHVTPEALGGGDEPSNLATACDACNSGKTSIAPGSPLVAQVAADAVRWSSAIQAAANQMLEDLGRRQQVRNAFSEAWNRWKRSGEPMSLPAGWAVSIDRFIAAGLPLPILLECMEKAMANSKLRDDVRFRYMCGIAWKQVAELQGSAQASLGIGVPSTSPVPVDGLEAGRMDFANELLTDHFTEEEREEALGVYTDPEGYGYAEDNTEYDIVTGAAYDAVSGTKHDLNYLKDAVEDLLGIVDPELVDLCDRYSLEQDQLHLEPNEVREERSGRIGYICRLVADILLFRQMPAPVQKSYLAQVNDEESASGLVIAAFRANPRFNRDPRYRCWVPPTVAGHAPCPSGPTYVLTFTECWIHEIDSPCAGHGTCLNHTHEFTNGEHVNPRTGHPAIPTRVEEVMFDDPPF